MNRTHALLILVLVSLVGCGDDDASTAPANSPMPGVTATTTATTTTEETRSIETPTTTPAETTPEEDSGGSAAPDAEETKTAEESGGSTAPGSPARKPQPSAKREQAAAYFGPRAGTSQDTFTLYASGFRPGAVLTVLLTRPDGQNVRAGSITAGDDGSGKLVLPKAQTSATGTYTAVVKNTATGASATAEMLVAG